jgi:serine/threonine protein kinase
MPKKCFSLVTITKFAIQSLEAFQSLHKHGFIHRDVKIANFVVGRKELETIYLIDFGLVKVYATPEGSLYPVFLNHFRFDLTSRLK